MDHLKDDRLKTAILLFAVAGLVSGLVLYLVGKSDLAGTAWLVGVLPALLALLIEILRSIGRGEVGLDIVAALSMTAALVFGENLAAAVVAVMYSGGTFLESFAEGRARREMHDLLSRVPRTATRHLNGGLEDVLLDDDSSPVKAALLDQPLIVHGTGKQSRCFTDVDDISDALIKLMETPKCEGNIYNVGSTESITIEELAHKIKKASNSKSKIEYMAYADVFEEGFEDMMKRMPDISKIEKAIGYKRKHTLDQIIERVINYYEE
jgi:hypothetical protein